MKKTIYIAIVVLAAALLALPQIAAAAGSWDDGTYTLGSGGGEASSATTYQLSNNVYLYYSADGTYMNYGLGSLHQSGNRSYATSNATTLIYWSDKSTGDTQDSDSEPTAGATDFGSSSAL